MMTLKNCGNYFFGVTMVFVAVFSEFYLLEIHTEIFTDGL